MMIVDILIAIGGALVVLLLLIGILLERNPTLGMLTKQIKRQGIEGLNLRKMMQLEAMLQLIEDLSAHAHAPARVPVPAELPSMEIKDRGLI